jgi:hypothetical protein
VSYDPTPAKNPPLGEPDDPARLAEELARERQEVLRLRGLLVARDAELGAARGRLLELETRARYVLGALRRLRALPALVAKAVGGLRGSRG